MTIDVAIVLIIFELIAMDFVALSMIVFLVVAGILTPRRGLFGLC